MNFADLLPLADHVWQSTLCAAAAWLLALALRRNRAAVRYRLWMAASVKFLVPFSLLVSIGNRLGWRSAPAIAQPQFSIAMNAISRAFTIPAGVSPPTDATQVASGLPLILLVVWLCGFTLGLIFWLRSVRQIRALEHSAAPFRSNLPIPVMSSPALMEPGVFGICKPVLLLPEGLADRLTPAQLDAVLAHEMCHVRRRDNLTAAIHMVVEVIFWFYPLVWWIRTELVAERERACDEEVVRVVSDPQVYAEGILNVCKFYLESPSVCVSGVAGADLKKRIVEIMADRVVYNLGRGKRILLSAIAVAAAIVPVAIGMLHMPASRSQSPVPAASLEFEVASIKPTDPTFSGRRVQMLPDDSMVIIRGMTLKGLIELAYAPGFGLLHPNLVRGGPKWYDRDRYDVLAKPEGHRIASLEERKQMLRALLVERFSLTFHRESKEITAFTLVVAKKGPRMKESKPGGTPSIEAKGLKIIGRSASMTELAAILQPMMPLVDATHADFPVIDRTGLTGRFDFDLEFALDETQADGRGGTPLNSNEPDLFTAIQEQLGLKLGLAKAPIEALVIDHAEMPSAN